MFPSVRIPRDQSLIKNIRVQSAAFVYDWDFASKYLNNQTRQDWFPFEQALVVHALVSLEEDNHRRGLIEILASSNNLTTIDLAHTVDQSLQMTLV